MAMVRDEQHQDGPTTDQDSTVRRPESPGVTRRGFLTGIGAGAASAAGSVALPGDAIAQTFAPPATRPDRFSRMFDDLRPFADLDSFRVTSALRALGAPGGILDAKDDLTDPVASIVDPARRVNNPDSGNVLANGTGLDGGNTAGVTFLGQFLDHDMTFDTTSRLGVPTRPERSPNARTPSFDLDTVYGGGPTVSPQLYRSDDRAKFRVENGGLFEDLPRANARTAIIGDPRNDENVMIAGLQVAFLKFHNNVVDLLRHDDGDGHRLSQREAARLGFSDIADFDRDRNVFAEARRIVTWHYQWIIVNEFLPAIVGASLVNNILANGRRFYRPEADQQSIPVEFQIAYRFGHSLVRPSYRANLAGSTFGPGAPAFFGFVFDPKGEGQPDPIDLRGGVRARRRFIGWQTFFNFGVVDGVNLAQHVRPSKKIDTKISTPLFHLPLGAIASGDQPISLPERNLLRHLTWSLPSGQSIANAMRITPLSSRQLSELRQFGVGFDQSTPLWYYILKEAELAGGTRLVGVGARLIAEVFLGLLQLDRSSYFSSRGWRPTLPSQVRGQFRITDLLTGAGVDPTARGQ